MQFKVPQNVQREDTIIGPITWKQLAILGIGGTITYAVYISIAKTYHVEVWLAPVAILSAITVAFAFLKIHSLPFHLFLMHFIEYHMLPKKRIWIKGCGDVFISEFDKKNNAKNENSSKNDNLTNQKTKSIDEISKILDSH